MASDLNPGFTNNINTLQIRDSGSSMQRLTDRAIDFDGDGDKETVVITNDSGDATGTPSAPGGKIRYHTNDGLISSPAGVARSVIQTIVEPDGGINTTGEEFTSGIE